MKDVLRMNKKLIGCLIVGNFDIPSEHVSKGKTVRVENEYYEEGEGKMIVYVEKGVAKHSPWSYWKKVDKRTPVYN